MKNGLKIGILLSIIAFWSVLNTNAQDTPENYTSAEITIQPDALLTQSWAMPTLLNPAATGEIDYIRIRGGARLDYLGSSQSPKNFLGAADSPFKVMGKRIGAGVIVSSSSYFLYRNLLIGAQGSYKFFFKKCSLSIGLQIGYFHSKFRGSDLKLTDLMPGIGEGDSSGPDLPGEGTEGGDVDNGDGDMGDDLPGDVYPDHELPTQDVAGGSFDASLGIKFEHPNFYVGLSGLHLTNPKIRLKKDSESATDLQYIEAKVPISLYFEAGGNIAINNSLFTLQPSLSVLTEFSDFQGIAEMRATYNQKITFGFNYRWNRAAGVVAGLLVKNFYIGYNWEYDYKNKPRGSTGNHEIVLGYQFKMDLGKKNNFSQRSIRIM